MHLIKNALLGDAQSLTEFFIADLKNSSRYSKNELSAIAIKAITALGHESRKSVFLHMSYTGCYQNNHVHLCHIDIETAPAEKKILAWILIGLIAVVAINTCIWLR